MKFVHYRRDVVFLESPCVLVSNAVGRKPFFIIVIFCLQLIKVDKQVVALCVVLAKVKLHASVKARLETRLLGFLVVVKVFVEVRHLLVSEFARLHAVLKDDSSRCFEIQALIIEVASERLHNAELHVVFRTGST